MNILKSLSDNRKSHSLANKLRRKRFDLFKSLIAPLPRPLKILDIGGTTGFWEQMDFGEKEGIEIVLLNLSRVEIPYSNIKSLAGNASKPLAFSDNEFDVVFSNSVIEHLGGFEQQGVMAEEIQRIGNTFFVQTPNLYFPIEAHFLFPFFQFMPQRLRVWLVTHFKMGWYPKIQGKENAIEIVNSIHLLSKTALLKLFPGAIIYKERFLGFTKSFIAYGKSEAVLSDRAARTSECRDNL
ncbi:MAG: class I SAM-dependent methyltransferase [Bacteroidales bacterium]|nr:class I SAM-dependent methyltransferase [Bacteroidales bacterium]